MKIETIDNSTHDPTLKPTYVVLGMLQEYMGRQVFDQADRVDSFFVNEAAPAHLLRKYLELMCHEVALDASIDLIGLESGHFTIISAKLAKHVNSLYPHDFGENTTYTDLDGNTGRYTWSGVCEKMFPPITSPRFSTEEIDPRYSFLYGAYLRYGCLEGLSYTFANASHKVDLIKTLLEQVECSWVAHRYTTRSTPISHSITFGATARLESLLADAKKELRSTCDGLGVSPPNETPQAEQVVDDQSQTRRKVDA